MRENFNVRIIKTSDGEFEIGFIQRIKGNNWISGNRKKMLKLLTKGSGSLVDITKRKSCATCEYALKKYEGKKRAIDKCNACGDNKVNWTKQK